MDETRVLDGDLREQSRAYFAAFLSGTAVREAMRELEEDVAYWGDTRPLEVLRTAHLVLESRVRVSEDVEALVLHEDLELAPDEVGQVMGLTPGQTQRLIEEVLAEIAQPIEQPIESPATDGAAPVVDGPADDIPDDIDREGIAADIAAAIDPDRRPPEPQPGPAEPVEFAPLAPPIVIDADDEPPAGVRTDDDLAFPRSTRGRDARIGGLGAGPRWNGLIVIGLIVLAIVVVIALFTGRDGGCGDAPICIEDAVMTDSVRDSGDPAEPRTTFTTAEDVRLWFEYRRVDQSPITLTIRWSREGQVLYSSDFRLPSADRVHIELAKLFMEEPGGYRVEILHGAGANEQVLIDEEFTITAADGTEADTEADGG
jgi:hypothetical protein